MFFSIITINYNDASGLNKSIQSVKEQSFDTALYELIVIDANSTDNSLTIIKNNLDVIYKFVSETDDGIFDGMNKGINLAKGKYLFFLNAGDVFKDFNTLQKCFELMTSSNKFYFGRTIVQSKSQKWKIPDEKVNGLNWLKKNVPNHQSCFYPVSFYHNNRFKLEFGIASDLDFTLRAVNFSGACYLGIDVAKFNYDGISSNINSFLMAKSVSNSIILAYKSNDFSSVSYTKVRINYYMKWLLSKFPSFILEKTVQIYNTRIKK